MVEFKKSNKEAVTEAEMQAVYKKIATPRKLGAVIKRGRTGDGSLS